MIQNSSMRTFAHREPQAVGLRRRKACEWTEEGGTKVTFDE